MHVGNNARKNEERTRDRKKPSDQAASTPKKQAHSDQHRQKRDTERIAAVKSPVGADHADLIAEKVSSNTSHGETDQEVAEAAGRPTHVAQGPIFHTGRISDAVAKDGAMLPSRPAKSQDAILHIVSGEAYDFNSSRMRQARFHGRSKIISPKGCWSARSSCAEGWARSIVRTTQERPHDCVELHRQTRGRYVFHAAELQEHPYRVAFALANTTADLRAASS